jgi:Tol biopolymer transport system component
MRQSLIAFTMALAAPALAQAPVSPATKLTEPQDDYPAVSPDGRSILFQSNRGGNWQLWQMNADGTGLKQMTSGPMNDRQPAWSPDGSKVAFSSDRGQEAGKRAIFVSGWPLGTTGILQISKGSGQDVHPKWLPDGSGLMFNRIAADGKQADVYVVTLEGAERMIDLGAGLNTYASVDPTGRALIYRGTTSQAGPNGPVENSDVFVASVDGTNKRRLTDDAAFDGWPAISPDGTTIAFASRRGGDKFRLFLMPISGGALREVTTPTGFHYTQPAWAPDGKSLVVYRWNADSAGEAGQLVRIALP